jgi:hypothetical protein
MESTALKLSAQDVIKEFTEAHGTMDLLRVYMITGSADISRSYELVAKWAKNAVSAADKAKFNSALKILQNIELRRIMLTEVMYNANEVTVPVDAIETTEESTAPTIMMVPQLDSILERVKNMLKGATDTQEAFELLKTTVGQGKVLNVSGQPETWDNEMINIFIKNNTEAKVEVSTPAPVKVEGFVKKDEVKPGAKFGFETIYGHFDSLIKLGKQEPEIKEALKPVLIGKHITSRDGGNDYFIKDETVFNDYYDRILSNIICVNIVAFNNQKNKATNVVNKTDEVAKKIEAEIKPFLENEDKDETKISLTPTARKMREIYSGVGIQKQLRDLFFDAKDLAIKWAPNLLKRQASASKNNIVTTPAQEETKAPVEQNTEIYDESHNIRESNKALWEEVKNYTYLNELFTKAQELCKAGNWKDALSMSIILISSGKIKETDTSKEIIKWDTDQIKLWYYNVVEASIQDVKETIDVKAEIIEDSKPEVKLGPVATIGSISSKEELSRLLKDNSLWKGTYTFKSFPVKTDSHAGTAMSLEIVDATIEQEKDLLITEHNMNAFFNEMRDKLVVQRNEEKNLRKVLFEKLSPFYELSSSECKRIIGNLVKEADAIRKVNKINARREAEKASEESTTQESTNTEETVMEVADDITKANIVKPEMMVGDIVPPTTPAEVEKSVESKEETNQSTENTAEEPSNNTTETTAGEEVTSTSNETVSYEGFEEIMKAKNKLNFDKAVYAKVLEYPKSEDGIKAVFDIVCNGRKDHHYKKSFIHQYKSANTVDLLSKVNKAYTIGVEMSKKQ